MQNKEDLNPAQKALESALGQLKPAASRLSRDELMFNAGRASVGKKAPWQMLSGALMVLLIGSVLIRPASNVPRELAAPVEPADLEVTPVVDEPARDESSGSLEYVTLRRNVIEHGLDALPLQQNLTGGEQNTSRKRLLESMLSS